EPELGIHRRRLPDGCAPVFPRVVVLRPAVVAELAGARDRVERPLQGAGACVECLQPPAGRPVAAGKTGDHQTVVVERGARDRKPVLPTLSLRRPGDLPGALVECHELAVELSHEDLAVPQAEPAALPAATDAVDLIV